MEIEDHGLSGPRIADPELIGFARDNRDGRGDVFELRAHHGQSGLVGIFKGAGQTGGSGTAHALVLQVTLDALHQALDELFAIKAVLGQPFLYIDHLVGHLAAWNYFQSADTEANAEWVAAWKARMGEDRVTNDPMEAHYIGFNMWVKAVEKAGTTDVDAVREAMYGLEVPNLTGGTAVMLPVVLAYTAYCYYLFRGKATHESAY